MEKVFKIGEDYILDIYIGLYKGTLEEKIELKQDGCIYCMLFLYRRCMQISSTA